MRNFGIGLGLGILGALLWVVASVLGGIGQAMKSPAPPIVTAFMTIGFIVMFLGPLVFWIILPIRNWLKRRKQ